MSWIVEPRNERSLGMPLTLCLLVGILAVIVGIAMFMATGMKKMAMVIMGIGFAMAVVTVVMVVLAVNSGM